MRYAHNFSCGLHRAKAAERSLWVVVYPTMDLQIRKVLIPYQRLHLRIVLAPTNTKRAFSSKTKLLGCMKRIYNHNFSSRISWNSLPHVGSLGGISQEAVVRSPNSCGFLLRRGDLQSHCLVAQLQSQFARQFGQNWNRRTYNSNIDRGSLGEMNLDKVPQFFHWN